MKPLRATLYGLGPPGQLGLVVLFLCALFYLGALQPAERELASGAGARAARDPLRSGAPDERAAQLDRFYALFPPFEHLGRELERLYALARASGLELLQGEYRLEAQRGGLVAYRIMLPVRGSYAQVRAFAAAVLAGMPSASLDGLRFERRNAADAQLEAQISLTMLFQPAQARP